MGFPVKIETNSQDVLTAASRAWASYPNLSAGEPVTVRVTVGGRATAEPAFDPKVEFDGAWMSISGDRGNRARADLSAGVAEIHLSEDVAADIDYVNYHFLKPVTYQLLAHPYFAFVHASCIALNDRAILLCGDASAGKTCLAFACARQGWTFLSGDATHLLHRSSDFCVAGRPFSIRFRESARDLFPELIAWPSSVRPNRKPCIEADTDKLNLRTALRAPASHIVFLERRDIGIARIEEISADEACERLDVAVFFGDDEVRRGQRATLRHFASLPAVRLIYSDLSDAEAALRSLSVGGS